MDWISVDDRMPPEGEHCICARYMGEGIWWFGCATAYEWGFPFTSMAEPNPVQYWAAITPPPVPSEDNG